MEGKMEETIDLREYFAIIKKRFWMRLKSKDWRKAVYEARKLCEKKFCFGNMFICFAYD